MAASSGRALLLPAAHHHVAAAHVDADHDRARRTPRRRVRRTWGRPPRPCPGSPARRRLEHARRCPPASAPRRRPARDRDRVADRRDHLAVVALVERRVEVDHVQPARALLLEARGHRDRDPRSRRSRPRGRPAAAGRRGRRAGRSRGSRSCRHRLHEVARTGEAGVAGLLRVELRREHVVASRPTAANVSPVLGGAHRGWPRRRRARTSARSRSACRRGRPSSRGAARPRRRCSSPCAATFTSSAAAARQPAQHARARLRRPPRCRRTASACRRTRRTPACRLAANSRIDRVEPAVRRRAHARAEVADARDHERVGAGRPRAASPVIDRRRRRRARARARPSAGCPMP